jgi:hypothetical protein
MTSWIEPPPQPKGMGCFARSCLTIFVFVVVLVAAFFGGAYLAFRHYRGTYFPATPIVLPQTNVSDVEIQRVLERWAAFETAVRAKQPARIELTAHQLNALIASEEKLRDKLFVTVEGNIAHVETSIPLEHVFWLNGHYINAECLLEAAPNKDPMEVKISNVIINNQTVSHEDLIWRYRSHSIRSLALDWFCSAGWVSRLCSMSKETDVITFSIEKGRVIFESKGES